MVSFESYKNQQFSNSHWFIVWSFILARPIITSTTTTTSTIRPSQTTSALDDWQPLFTGSSIQGFGEWLGGVNNRFPVSYADVQPQFVFPINLDGEFFNVFQLLYKCFIWSQINLFIVKITAHSTSPQFTFYFLNHFVIPSINQNTHWAKPKHAFIFVL